MSRTQELLQPENQRHNRSTIDSSTINTSTINSSTADLSLVSLLPQPRILSTRPEDALVANAWLPPHRRPIQERIDHQQRIAADEFSKEHALTKYALQSFNKIDRDQNGFLSELELKEVIESPSWKWNQGERDAAKYIHTNYYNLRKIWNDDRDRGRQDDLGISKRDLETVRDVTTPGYDVKVDSRNRRNEALGVLALSGLSIAAGAIMMSKTNQANVGAYFLATGLAEFGAGGGLFLGRNRYARYHDYVRKQVESMVKPS